MPSLLGICRLGNSLVLFYRWQMPTLDRMPTLLGNAELGQLLGVSRQRVSQIVSSPSFPKPYATLAMGSIWTLEAVTDWAQRTGRQLHDRSVGSSVED